MIIWQLLPFNKLSALEFHQLIQLRIDVFVVEQNCPYPELDGKDTLSGVHHLMGFKDGELIACARLLAAGISYDNPSLGRLATKMSMRGNGLGHQLLAQALLQCEELWPSQTVDISAQEHLAKFYQGYGFKTISEMYLEDDIPHITMRLNKP